MARVLSAAMSLHRRDEIPNSTPSIKRPAPEEGGLPPFISPGREHGHGCAASAVGTRVSPRRRMGSPYKLELGRGILPPAAFKRLEASPRAGRLPASVWIAPYCDLPNQASSAENAWLIPFSGLRGSRTQSTSGCRALAARVDDLVLTAWYSPSSSRHCLGICNPCSSKLSSCPSRSRAMETTRAAFARMASIAEGFLIARPRPLARVHPRAWRREAPAGTSAGTLGWASVNSPPPVFVEVRR